MYYTYNPYTISQVLLVIRQIRKTLANEKHETNVATEHKCPFGQNENSAIRQDETKQTSSNEIDVSLSFLSRSDSKQSRGKVCRSHVFDPGMQSMFLRHHKVADIVLLFGLCFPVSCFRSTRANTPLTQVRRQDHLLCLA